MRNLFTILAAILLTASMFLSRQASAQSPEKMSYQAVIRNSSNALITNMQIGMKISILQGTATGTAVYVETQTPTTNANGLVGLEIGTGTIITGTFAAIDWSAGTYFIKTETDPTGGTTYTITGTSQLLSVPYALHAKTAESVTKTNTYKVGDFAQGGVIFWLDETGQHGLVAAKSDQSAGVRWYAGTSGNTQAKGDGPFAGKANTAIIIAAQIAIGDNDTTYAARICNELLITDTIEGGIVRTYGDWYLPSKWEVTQIYQNRVLINAAARAHGGASLDIAGTYWSSTEYIDVRAWRFNFFNSADDALKDRLYKVRAVRAF